MSASGSIPSPLDTAAPSADPTVHQSTIQRLLEGDSKWDQRLIAASDWINPILVKETRQALKSRQFLWTFSLLTIVVLGWSVLAIISMMPSIYYASDGRGLLAGYVVILIVPAMIIIPQASFRSMASEIEDGTFETLSLSTLSPRQIVLGKLSVALVQLIVYVSILAPCIALTYLLRGVTLEVILLLLISIATASVTLSVIALTLASLSVTRMLQVLFSLVLSGIQLFAAFYIGAFLVMVPNLGSIEAFGWTMVCIVVLFTGLYAWLCLRCAAAMLGMASDNRSTPIRIPLLTIGLIIATMGLFFIVLIAEADSLMVGAMLSTVLTFHWGISGAFIIGERGIIPARARRTLPSSLLGRIFLTWLNPGAGPGYIFVLLGLAGSLLPIAIVPLFTRTIGGNFQYGELLWYNLALLSYVAIYLGFSRLVILLLMSRVSNGRMVVSVALNLVLLVLAVVGSCSISLAANNYTDLEFDWYCFINPFWTLTEVLNRRWSYEQVVALALVYITASVVVLLNVLFVTRDVLILRIRTPDRVIAERTHRAAEWDDKSDGPQVASEGPW